MRLPATITLSTDNWTVVGAATAALARLDGAARLIPNPSLLRRPILRRGAQSTGALEGTFAPFTDVLAADPNDEQHLTAELRGNTLIDLTILEPAVRARRGAPGWAAPAVIRLASA